MIGSIRQPKAEPKTPVDTGFWVGTIMCLIFCSNRRDSITVIRSTRCAVSCSKSVNVVCNSSIDSGRPEMSAPPLPGLALISAGLMPARPDTRSPRDSSCVTLACISPSRLAKTSRFSRRNRSRCSTSSRTTSLTSEPTTGHPSRAPLRKTQWYSPAATSMSASAMATPAIASRVPLR